MVVFVGERDRRKDGDCHGQLEVQVSDRDVLGVLSGGHAGRDGGGSISVHKPPQWFPR